MRRANALDSMTGKAAQLAGNVGGQARKSEVHTPDWIWDVVREAGGGEIVLDPCAASDPLHWRARYNVTLPDNALALEWGVGDGLIYFNPPFNQLGPTKAREATEKSEAFPFTHGGWMAKAQAEAQRGRRLIGLVPFRPHRHFFFQALKGSTVVFLHYDVVFVGHTQAYPAPLALVCWNVELPSLGGRETGRLLPR